MSNELWYLVCRPGDVLESVNGVNLSNVDHCDAVCAISDNKGILNLVRRDIHSHRAIALLIVNVRLYEDARILLCLTTSKMELLQFQVKQTLRNMITPCLFQKKVYFVIVNF